MCIHGSVRRFSKNTASGSPPAVETQADGAMVDHAFRVVEPKVGAEELTDFFERTNRVGSIRAGMRQTLTNLKAAAEAVGGTATGTRNG